MSNERKAGNARVVSVSSRGHLFAGIGLVFGNFVALRVRSIQKPQLTSGPIRLLGRICRDRSNIGGGVEFLTTLLYFVLCSLPHTYEIPARQG
jgi:hypothetical protein